MTRRAFGVFIGLFGVIGLALAAETPAVEGTVRGADGKSLQGADVRLEAQSTKAAPVLTKTDGSGKYRFTNVSRGVYRVTVLSGKVVRGFIDGIQVNGTKRIDFDIKPTGAKKAKHLVYVPAQTGSHIGGGWVEFDDDNATATGDQRVKKMSGDQLRRLQTGGQGTDGH